MRRPAVVLALVLPLASACATGRRAGSSAPSTPAPAALAIGDHRGLAHELLHAALWMQTSAEFEALSLATYRAATAALAPALADRSWTAAVEQAGDFADKPPAVIVDIDETVLDNSPFQGQLVIDDAVYDEAAWKSWVTQAVSRPMAGALDFARAAAERKVAVFYVTNRSAELESDTLRNLLCAERAADGACSGFPVADRAAILCRGETPPDGGPAWSGDKTDRRRYLAERYRILLLVGDDLRDFLYTPSSATAESRVALAREQADKWGSRWFLLPNPAYGSWERALYGSGLDDRGVLEAKRARVRGYRSGASPAGK
jgi:acid phosphatase